MNKNHDGSRIMREHGVYPLLGTITNDALLSTVCGCDTTGEYVSLYVDAKGFHLVWRTVKRDKDGYTALNGGSLSMETVSVDITVEFAKKLDYDGEAPDFTTTPKDKDDDHWFVAAPEAEDGYAFALCGLRDDRGAHVSHVFATDGIHARLLLAPDSKSKAVSLEHSMTALAIDHIPADAITRLETDADILSKAKELMK